MSLYKVCSKCKSIAPTYLYENHLFCEDCLRQVTDDLPNLFCCKCGRSGLRYEDVVEIINFDTGESICFECEVN